MFRIGDFSKFSVSVRMLRHYDQLGLLKPAHIDPHSEYRYYSADQLPLLHRILALQDLGFSLDQIGELLDKQVSTAQLVDNMGALEWELNAQQLQKLAQVSQIDLGFPHNFLEGNPNIFGRTFDLIEPRRN